VTGSGQATLVTGWGERLDLGQAIFDLRGETYVSRAP